MGFRHGRRAGYGVAVSWPEDPGSLLVAPRGRRLCWALVAASGLADQARIGPAWDRVLRFDRLDGGPADLAGELAAVVAGRDWPAVMAGMSEVALAGPLAESVGRARVAVAVWPGPGGRRRPGRAGNMHGIGVSRPAAERVAGLTADHAARRAAGPHAARGQPGMRPMLAATIGPQPGCAPGPVSQPGGLAHRVWAGACVRVVTDPECRALAGWKAFPAAGSRPAPRGSGLCHVAAMPMPGAGWLGATWWRG